MRSGTEVWPLDDDIRIFAISVFYRLRSCLTLILLYPHYNYLTQTRFILTTQSAHLTVIASRERHCSEHHSLQNLSIRRNCYKKHDRLSDRS